MHEYMYHYLQRYLAEDQRLRHCKGLVACYVPAEIAVLGGLPVKPGRVHAGLVELDVTLLQQAHDVSPN